jgi:hypothetical protein
VAIRFTGRTDLREDGDETNVEVFAGVHIGTAAFAVRKGGWSGSRFADD